MPKSISKKKIVITLLSFVVVSGFTLPTIIFSLSDKLSVTNRVDANIILVEGWLPPYAINLTYQEIMNSSYDHIITTGLRSTPDYFDVYTNGFLTFYSPNRHLLDSVTNKHTIGVEAYSSLSGTNKAHFNVFINDAPAGDFFADKRKRSFEVEWEGKLSKIDSISVQFTNDTVSESGDRNLFVRDIILDHKISVPYQKNSIYFITEKYRNVKSKNDYNSVAEHARNMLLSKGIDTSLIVSVPCKNVTFNRTLTSALAFRDWLINSDIRVKGINIVSLGTHARRTWMIYNKILGKKYKIGIISLPDYKERYSRRYKILRTIRESLGIVYYWFILTPY